MSGKGILIVNADDLGRSPGINVGILEAHREGIVTSTTLMVNTHWTEDARRMALEVPSLGVGLHLNFCYGRPLSSPVRIPTLVDDGGNFETDTPRLRKRADPRHIQIEALTQLDRFESLMGRLPTHLDSHKYLHSFHPFLDPVRTIARERHLPVRALGDADRIAYRAGAVATPDHFAGSFHGMEGDGVSAAVLGSILDSLAPGTTELMCHPGYVDKHLDDSSYRNDREAELRILCDPMVRRVLEGKSVQLANFSVLI